MKVESGEWKDENFPSYGLCFMTAIKKNSTSLMENLKK